MSAAFPFFIIKVFFHRFFYHRQIFFMYGLITLYVKCPVVKVGNCPECLNRFQRFHYRADRFYHLQRIIIGFSHSHDHFIA